MDGQVGTEMDKNVSHGDNSLKASYWLQDNGEAMN